MSDLSTWEKEALEGVLVSIEQVDPGDRVRATYYDRTHGTYFVEGEVHQEPGTGFLFVGNHTVALAGADNIRLIKARPDAREVAIEQARKSIARISGAPTAPAVQRRIAIAVLDALDEQERS